MDITGIEPVAFELRTRRDTTTPYTLHISIVQNTNIYHTNQYSHA